MGTSTGTPRLYPRDRQLLTAGLDGVLSPDDIRELGGRDHLRVFARCRRARLLELCPGGWALTDAGRAALAADGGH